MFPSVFEPEIGTIEQPLTHALDGAATGISQYNAYDCTFVFGWVTIVLWDHVLECTTEINSAVRATWL